MQCDNKQIEAYEGRDGGRWGKEKTTSVLVLADRDQTGRVGTDGSDPRGDRGASESGRSESVSQSVRSGLTQ